MDIIMLNIPGIAGESQRSGFENQIELISCSHGSSTGVVVDQSNADRTLGGPDVRDITFTKHVDKTTPQLSEACFEGTLLPEVTLTACHYDGGVLASRLVYEMENCVLSAMSIERQAGDAPVERFTMTFRIITWAHHKHLEEGDKSGQAARS